MKRNKQNLRVLHVGVLDHQCVNFYIDDLGSASVFALEYFTALSSDPLLDDNDKPCYFLNVGTGDDLSIKQLALEIANVVGYKGSIEWDISKPDGTPKKQLNVMRMTKLGWQASIKLSDGLLSTYSDFLENLSESTLRIMTLKYFFYIGLTSSIFA